MPFLGAFLVTWFIFIMQYMWLWIDDFIGKGLDALTVLQFLALLSTTLVPIALPLGILFASIMTFGNLGETSELVAIKSSGISIAKFAKPLFYFILLITISSFFFNNYVIPQAAMKVIRLQYDIGEKKPTVAIKPGSFYSGISNHSIYIGKKDNDGKKLYDIKIYDHSGGRGNNKITLAKEGYMYISDDKRFLIFELMNGSRYEEKFNEKTYEDELIRLHFKYWKKVFDLSDFKMPKTDESFFKGLRATMNAYEIKKQIDTNKIAVEKMYDANKELVSKQLHLIQHDSIEIPKITKVDKFDFNQIPDTLKRVVLSHTETTVRNIKSMLEVNKQNTKLQNLNLTESYIELHKRFTLPFSCILLFIIGSALGSIIRKGGLGMPFVAAIIFFVIYYVLNTVGEKIAKEHVLPVELGMWLPSLILLAIGIFLMVKANNDSPLMNKEWYFRVFSKLKKKIKYKN